MSIFDQLLGFNRIQRKIEKKLIQLSFIPSKYFEALYVECGTKITCHTCDITEIEEKAVRNELLQLMKKGKVDTKIELEKFQLFERINSVSIKSLEIRLLMNEYSDKMKKENYDRLVILLKEVSYAAKLMHYAVKDLYDSYDKALHRVDELYIKCDEITEDLFSFRFFDRDGDGIADYSFEDPEVLIGNSLRGTLMDLKNVGNKIVQIIRTFSYNHHHLKDIEEVEEKEKDEGELISDK